MSKGDISEFARELLRTDNLKVDGMLQEVRDVLAGISDDECFDACFLRWMKKHEDSDGFTHSEACERAHSLLKRLAVDREG